MRTAVRCSRCCSDRRTATTSSSIRSSGRSGVPTCSFRASVSSRRSPVNITGANVAEDYIGKYNGGGIQVIYDADNSVISEVTGGDAYGVLGIASPEFLASEGSTEMVEGLLDDKRRVVARGHQYRLRVQGVVTHEFGHAINLAHTQTNGFYSSNNPNAWSRCTGGPEQAGPDQCGVRGRQLSGGEPDRDHVPHDRSVAGQPHLQQPRDGQGPGRRRRHGGAVLDLIRPRTMRRSRAPSRAASSRRTARASSPAST